LFPADRNVVVGIKTIVGLTPTRRVISKFQVWILWEQTKQAGAQFLYVDFPSADEIVPLEGWDWEFAVEKSGSQLSESEVAKFEFYRSLFQISEYR